MRLLKLVSAVVLAAVASATLAQPVKIRVAYVVPVANWPSILFEKHGLARHHGKSYAFEAVHFQGTPQMITALANNELEVADLAFASFAIAVQNAGMDDLRVIADEFQDGVDGYYTNEFFVLKDGADPGGQGPEGQGARHQRRRQRGRHRRCASCCARTASTTART